MWRADGPQGHEADKIAHLIVPYTRGDVLDIGCGDRSPWPHFIGVDSGKQWGQRVAMIHGQGEDLSRFGNASWDAVFSSHFLEHTVDYKAALREWWRVIKPGGHLVLYIPDKRYYPNIGQYGANSDHKWDLLPDDIVEAMKDIGKESGWTCLENEVRTRDNEYSFFLVLKKRSDGTIQFAQWEKPEKTVLVCRYGGIGDHIMAASILPHLKAEGCHITYMTTPLGRDVMLHDPNVDAFWIQDTDQVPNQELGAYWESLRIEGRWDRFIQLSESVERGLLVAPGQISHAYPHDARHALLNVNYLERTHDIACVPKDRFHQKFYPSKDELKVARAVMKGFGRPVVYWPLVGSSVHKWYPWVPEVCRWLVEKSDCQIVLTSDGGRGKQMQEGVIGALENNGVKTDRIACMAGEWSLRQSLTFATVADVVVGPETGVTNAAAMELNRKVLFLSHSSVENLTKHWVNTVSLSAKTACYPCHKLHYEPATCSIDPKTSAARCAAEIVPDLTFRAIMEALHGEAEQAA